MCSDKPSPLLTVPTCGVAARKILMALEARWRFPARPNADDTNTSLVVRLTKRCPCLLPVHVLLRRSSYYVLSTRYSAHLLCTPPFSLLTSHATCARGRRLHTETKKAATRLTRAARAFYCRNAGLHVVFRLPPLRGNVGRIQPGAPRDARALLISRLLLRDWGCGSVRGGYFHHPAARAARPPPLIEARGRGTEPPGAGVSLCWVGRR
ncbi:hypothetical protein C8J57DRAFT_1529407 [Mycena rebaudengoi]|nr:hypothetical protein C8J57DRAFT_1529407 [Mycena rebaudengoi]